MEPHQFNDSLARLGLSKRKAARLFGVNERTVRRWGRGESRVKQSVQSLLWLMVNLQSYPDEVAEAVKTTGTAVGVLEYLMAA